MLVKAPGVASEALAEPGATMPFAQLSVTVTEPGLFGTKSFWTVKGFWRLLMNVQRPISAGCMTTPLTLQQ